MSLVWVNGKLVDKADARVGLFDHGFLYGDGVWEPLRVFGGRPFRAAEHVARLFSAAGVFEIEIPYTRAEVLAAVEWTITANHRTDGYCRVLVTRGAGTIGPDPRKLDPQVYVTVEEYYPFPVELQGHGLHVVTSPYPVNTANPAFWQHALGRPDVVLARRFALKAGCLDAVLTDHGGHVIGTTEGELFQVRGGAIGYVPPCNTPEALAVLLVARANHPQLSPGTVTPADLAAADEVFLVGAACGVIGVVRIDGRDIGTGTAGPVTRAVQAEYRKLTRGGIE
jgi:branched-chain amino acid aminotransferase